MKQCRVFIIMLIVFNLLVSCEKGKDSETAFGQITFNLTHNVNGLPLQTDVPLYTNAAGNRYQISEVQWFISNIRLYDDEGNEVVINTDGGIYYVDTDLPETQKIAPDNQIPAGLYKKIRFTFGLNEEENQSYRFLNPPESFMFWPEYLGGGYHYLKLNGKWLNPDDKLAPFNFHLGIGQEYFNGQKHNNPLFDFGKSYHYQHCEGYLPPETLSPIVGFYQNYFDIEKMIEFSISPTQNTQIVIAMNIENWFRGSHQYNHNEWGGSIMQIQEAMQQGCENGRNVFTVHLAKSE